jgi:hypothetical protein
VFATWIPEALTEIEALRHMENPPSALMIGDARRHVVNWVAGASRPEIGTEGPSGKVRIAFRWPGYAHIILPGNGLAVITDIPEIAACLETR